MDSILQLMGLRFIEHRKLDRPFKEEYKKRLSPSMSELIAAIHKENWPAALKAYSTLTRKCNGCHVDLEIDKEVLDWTK